MLIVAGHLRVVAAERDRFVNASRTVVEQARSTKGCLDFALSADLIESDRVLVFERWDDRAAVEAFRGSGPGDEQLEVIEEFVVNEFDVVSSTPPQEVRAALAAIPVGDMEDAESWYSSLLGREPDSRPMDGLVESHLTASIALQLVLDPDRAGGGLVTLQVGDLSSFVVAAKERGIKGLASQSGEVVTAFASISDPDGNGVTIVQT